MTCHTTASAPWGCEPALNMAPTHLGQAVAHALGQVQVTCLIDEVEAGVPGLTVIEQVHGGHSLGLGGSQEGSTGSNKASQHLRTDQRCQEWGVGACEFLVGCCDCG